MKKRIFRYLSFILVFAMACPMLAYAEGKLYTEQEKQRYEDHIGLLIDLNIIEEKMDFTQTVTRGELARILVALASGEAVVNEDMDFGFTDVNIETKYADYIIAGAQRGYFSGYDDGSFRPNVMIKAEEAVCAFVRATGYETIAEQRGGYTDGYFSIAKETGLLKGMDVYVGYDITYMTLVQLVMNAMDIDFLEVEFDGGITKLEHCENKFTKRLGLEKRIGIVDATDNSSLYNDSRLADNKISIDGSIFSLNDDYGDLLGYCVEYYVDVEDGDAIIYVNKRIGKGKEIVIESEDIKTYENRKYSYFVNDREKNFELPDDIAIIYNGVSETEPTDTMMHPTNGRIKLLDNDGDNEYDVLYITQYDTYIVYYVDISNKKIYDAYDSSKVIAIEEDGKLSIKDVNGADVALEKIAKRNVLSVKQSANGAVTEIIVCNNSIRGTVEGIEDEEVKISGTVYDIADTVAGATLTLGRQAMFFFDAFGKIVAVSGSDVDGMNIGYLAKATMLEDDIDDRICMKI